MSIICDTHLLIDYILPKIDFISRKECNCVKKSQSHKIYGQLIPTSELSLDNHCYRTVRILFGTQNERSKSDQMGRVI